MTTDFPGLVSRYLPAKPPVTPEVVERLASFATLLDSFNGRLNLVSYRDPRELIVKHVVDCVLASAIIPETGRLCDIGAGGGFPGIVFALLRPAASFTLVESNGAKARFLETAAKKLGLSNVTVRCDDHHRITEPFDGLVFRGFAKLGTLLAVGGRLLTSGGTVYALKGPRFREEMEEVPARQRNLYEEPEIFEYELPEGTGSRAVLVCRRS